MQPPSTTRTASAMALTSLCTLCLVAAPMHAQQPSSALPATSPTQPLVSQLQAQPSAVTYGVSTDHLANVTYAAGKLSVAANDSSLNQILRDISRKTGMKITGGVTDERVFGNYGPDTPARVLSALLDGTGSNMLLIQGVDRQATGSAAPVELVLSPRNGGPTPPNPHPQPFDNSPRQPLPPQAQQPSYPIAAPLAPGVSASPNTGAATPGAAGGATSSDGSTQQSPNGVKTPQQIYEELQHIRTLQQQQQQMQQTH